MLANVSGYSSRLDQPIRGLYPLMNAQPSQRAKHGRVHSASSDITLAAEMHLAHAGAFFDDLTIPTARSGDN